MRFGLNDPNENGPREPRPVPPPSLQRWRNPAGMMSLRQGLHRPYVAHPGSKVKETDDARVGYTAAQRARTRDRRTV